MKSLVEQYRAARAVATPLIGITTPDPAATVLELSAAMGGKPALQWDIIRGLAGLNEAGAKAINVLLAEAIAAGGEEGINVRAITSNVTDMLGIIGQVGLDEKTGAPIPDQPRIPTASTVFMLNAHRYLVPTPDGAATSQGIWNLRELFKANASCLVLVAPFLMLPEELTQDVLILDQPLPSREDLSLIVKEAFEAKNASRASAKKKPLAPPEGMAMERAVDALRGLASFPADQTVSENITDTGLDMPALWLRKDRTIEQTPGLSVMVRTNRFAALGGLKNSKDYTNLLLAGRDRPRALAFVDEIEKGMAGIEGDLSGVAQEMHGELLRQMQDYDIFGVLLLGHPGTGKSAIAKAAPQEAPDGGIQGLNFNISAMKGSLVGQSIARMRQACKVLLSISDGRPVIYATCNSIAGLSPELRRRFPTTFFFDLPTVEEQDGIWAIYRKQFEIDAADVRPPCPDWTGAEIRTCCNLAWRFGIPLVQAARFIVPMAVSAKDKIEALRQQAHGKYLSASEDRVYEYAGIKNIGAVSIDPSRQKRAFEN